LLSNTFYTQSIVCAIRAGPTEKEVCFSACTPITTYNRERVEMEIEGEEGEM